MRFSYIILLTLLLTLQCTISLHSQTIYGSSTKKKYFGLQDPNASYFNLNPFYIPLWPPWPEQEYLTLDYNFSVNHGELEIEYFPEENNIWQVSYGFKTDSGIDNGDFNTWHPLQSTFQYFITDSLNPYPHNVEHSIKLKFDTLMFEMNYPLIHDLNISIAEGDTLFIEVGNDNALEGIESPLFKYMFYKEDNFLQVLYGEGGMLANMNTSGLFETYGLGFHFFNILKFGFTGGPAVSAVWNIESHQTPINYLKLTLKSYENNVTNAGVAFGGFFIYDPAIYLSVEEAKLNKYNTISYPNPFNEILNLNAKSNLNFNFVEILDLNGRVVKGIDNISNANQLNLASLKSGVYFIRFYYNSSIVKTEKLIKQ